ncbi:MAG: hypothetical protein QOF18_2640, partial [Frankiaceae bacterium]|nr:hypothetical protein [Frankiaceae bacterium]
VHVSGAGTAGTQALTVNRTGRLRITVPVGAGGKTGSATVTITPAA